MLAAGVRQPHSLTDANNFGFEDGDFEDGFTNITPQNHRENSINKAINNTAPKPKLIKQKDRSSSSRASSRLTSKMNSLFSANKLTIVNN